MTPRVSAERLKGIEREAEKKAIETARYVIPIAAFTSMVHTISGITLHRLRRMAAAGDTPHEAVARDRPHGGSRPRDRPALLREGRLRGAHRAGPARSRRFPRPRGDGDAFAREFDARLERPGVEADRQLRARAARHRRRRARHLRADRGGDARRGGHRSRAEPGAQPVPPRRDERVVSLADDARAAPRVVHVREAPQPHRRLAGPAPPDGAGLAAAHDVCRHVRARLRGAAAHRRRTRRRSACTGAPCGTPGHAKNRLLELGVPLEFALYVLPNAKALRMVESGALIALLHKWTLRTCFNAQEEIYLASMDEVAQVRGAPPAARAARRPAVRRAQRPHLAALHGGHPFLRHPRVAQLPERRPASVVSFMHFPVFVTPSSSHPSCRRSSSSSSRSSSTCSGSASSSRCCRSTRSTSARRR